MADTVRFLTVDPPIQSTYAHTVAIRENWSDPWEQVSILHASQIAWKVAPEISEATLFWRFPEVILPGNTTFSLLSRLAARRHYVRIAIDLGSSEIEWFGTIEVDGEALLGARLVAGEYVAGGMQTLICYGLEHLLNLHRVADAWVFDEDEDLDSRRVHRGLEFNRGGLGNRSEDEPTIWAYVFNEKTDLDLPKWSTREIVRYLVTYQVPRDELGDISLPWVLENESVLPEWDAPVLPTQGVSVRQLLNRLMPRERLLSYYLRVNEDDHIVIHPFSWVDTALSVDGDHTLPANDRQRILVFDSSPHVEAGVKYSAIDQYEQVITIGAPRTSTGTLSFVEDRLVKGWKTEIKERYDKGASESADYPPATEKEKREAMNRDAREAPDLESAYSRIAIGDDWDQKDAAGRPFFPDDDDPTTRYYVYNREIFILPRLALLENHDYSGDVIEDEEISPTDDGPFDWRRPFVFIETETGYRQAEKWGVNAGLEHSSQDQSRRFHLSVAVPREDRGFLLKVSGAPQHSLGYGIFTPLPADDPKVPQIDITKVQATLTLQDDRYAQAAWPDPAAEAEVVRILVLQAGDNYRVDWVCNDTVVGLTFDGARIRSNGGFARDDRDKLEQISRLAFGWYGAERTTLEVTSGQLLPMQTLWLGDMILSSGDPDVAGDHIRVVKTPISAITVQIPRSTGFEIGRISAQYATAGVAFDPLSTPKARRPMKGEKAKGTTKPGALPSSSSHPGLNPAISRWFG